MEDDGMTRATIAALLILLTTPAAAADLSGRATAVDGDTLRIAGQSVRLWGVSAPELREPYGRQAKEALAIILDGRDVICQDTGKRSHKRVVARCRYVDGMDIGMAMVMFGFAKDCPRFSGGHYAQFERAETRLPYDLPRYCEVRR